ncbi:MAG TPA: aspartate aminotransferase family protein [Symbiobacteriaceae bacterium]|nr:aspartate aminotransferase family protein [Symbiobacteriaceae bacterium]
MTLSNILLCHPVAPVEITRARGTSFYDRDGKPYIDFEAGIWCNALGHNHPRIMACLQKQAAEVMHLGPMFTGSLTDAAAGALLRHTPHPDGKVAFLSSGSEAVEMGIRLSRQATGRRRLLTLGRSYLGAYGEAMQESQAVWTKVDLAPCQTCPLQECTARCPHLAHLVPEETAAFVLEPVLASGGIIVPPTKLVRLLANITQAAGGLVVVDEVTTGFGRTGTWWGFEHAGITPDVIACGKALGNGFPVSAVIASAAAAEAAVGRGFRHSQSHQNDPLAAAIALEVIRIFEEEQLVDRVAGLGEALQAHLRALKHPLIVDVRGLGLMVGVELQNRQVSGRPLIEHVWERMLEQGYFIGIKAPLSLLRFLPPLTITTEEISAVSSALGDLLASIAPSV